MLSIKDNDKYEEIIKYSKFISFIFRVYSKNEVNDYIDKIKKEYPNATHYCYGYVIDNDIKSSDDGEPSRTAGAPILNQITGNNLNYTLIKQNEISSQQQLIYKFKQDVNSVLLGTGVFWEGISIEGIALSNLIIYKLPFPLPEPIINEKCKRSKNPLEEVLVPEMIIKLKQGVGRLIRNKTDKGIVSIIDSRLGDKSKASYKEKVWQALPIKQRTNSLKELQSFYDNL